MFGVKVRLVLVWMSTGRGCPAEEDFVGPDRG